MTFRIRLAVAEELALLTELIDESVRGLQTADYTAAQINCALASVYGVDTQLIADQTYYAVEAESIVVACGGWSKRKTLYGGDRCAFARENSLLDPSRDAAKIRAFFVRPAWVRHGIGTLLLKTCEQHAIAAGFRRLEMGSTLTGVPLYRAHGYVEVERLGVPLDNGDALPVLRMERTVSAQEACAAPADGVSELRGK